MACCRPGLISRTIPGSPASLERHVTLHSIYALILTVISVSRDRVEPAGGSSRT